MKVFLAGLSIVCTMALGALGGGYAILQADQEAFQLAGLQRFNQPWYWHTPATLWVVVGALLIVIIGLSIYSIAQPDKPTTQPVPTPTL